MRNINSTTVFGWSEGQRRPCWDGTGIFHLIVAELRQGLTVGVAACNRNRMVSGCTESPSRGHKCRVCKKIAAKYKQIGWKAASNGGKRPWFVMHHENHVYYANRKGVLVRFATCEAAKTAADALNREHPDPPNNTGTVYFSPALAKEALAKGALAKEALAKEAAA